MKTKKTEGRRLDAGRTRAEYKVWMLQNNLGIAMKDVTAAETSIKAALARTGEVPPKAEKALQKAREWLAAVEAELAATQATK